MLPTTYTPNDPNDDDLDDPFKSPPFDATMHVPQPQPQPSAVNPFATPFDDEHRVPNVRFQNRNPFAAVAL